VFTRERYLQLTPPACVVPEGVFDAFGWCSTGELRLRTPAAGLALGAELTDENPAEMVFVFHGPPGAWLDLPRELATLHAPALTEPAECILAPYAIDDATDAFYTHRCAPNTQLLLATTTLRGVFWGLHDWCHFHNHGPFEARAWTELQCDVAALTWMFACQEALECSSDALRRIAVRAEKLAETRFQAEGFGASLAAQVRTHYAGFAGRQHRE
jgi:hypothetical protein